MNTKSIRFRLFLWYSLTLFVGILVTFVSFFLVSRTIIFQQVDRELSTHALKLSEIITREGIDIHDLIIRQQLYTEFSNIPGMVVVLLDPDGNIVRSSHDTPGLTDTLQVLFQRSLSQGETYETLNLGDTPMRFMSKTIYLDEDPFGVIIVAHPVDAIQKSFTSLISMLLTIFPLIVILTMISGSLLIFRIIRPLVNISDQVSTITSEHLDKRIVSPGTGDEIENLAHTFNDLLNRLQSSFKRERLFLGDVAHELKTPITTLKGQLELSLERNRSAKEYQQVLSDSLSDVNRLSDKIKNILDLAWLNTENSLLQENKVDLSSLFDELLEIAEKLALQKNVRISSKIAAGIFIKGSEDKLMRALLNVLDNAIKYSPAKGMVSISLSKKNGDCLVEVKDQGQGISKEDLPHIFDRFYRGSKTSKIYGSGLGLAITKGIVQSHQGRITIKSSLGKGTKVRIIFPTIS